MYLRGNSIGTDDDDDDDGRRRHTLNLSIYVRLRSFEIPYVALLNSANWATGGPIVSTLHRNQYTNATGNIMWLSITHPCAYFFTGKNSWPIHTVLGGGGGW